MFLSIHDNRSGEEFVRRLAPLEHLDLRLHVRRWVQRETDGAAVPSFSEPGSHIGNGCGEFQAEIRDTKSATGACWFSEPFFLEWSEA